MTNTVSLYIPVYNAHDYLEQTLEAVLQQTVRPNEIIIVDDGSTDGSGDLSKRFPVIMIRHGVNRGLGAARNTAVLAARSEFVAALDADCVPEPEWLANCLGQFADLHTAGVGGMLIEPDNGRVCDVWRSVFLSQHFGEGTKPVPFIAGSNTVFRRQALVAAGLYNPVFRRNHEDTDICVRLIQHGYQLMYTSTARVRHIKHDTWYSLMRTCWGFRHTKPAGTIGRLIIDIFREARFSFRLMGTSIIKRQWRFFAINSGYFFVQLFLCIKAYVRNTSNIS